MHKKLISIILFLVMLAISGLIYRTQEPPTPPSPMPQALATTGLPVISLSTRGQIYDCANKSVGGFKIKVDNITIRNCNVYASADYSFEVRANNLTVENVNVYNNRTEGSIFDFVLPDGSCVSGTTIRNLYADGDVGWAVTGRICGMLMEDARILRVGKSSNSGKHAFYFNHSNNITLRRVSIEDVWNSCIKIVGNVSYIYFDGVTCKDIGTSRDYGSALMIGEGGDTARSTNAHHLYLNNFVAINIFDKNDVEVYDQRTPVTEVYINNVYFPVLKSMDSLPPVITISPTPTFTALSPTRTSTPTATRTPSPVPPTPVPTFCETAVSEHFWFQGCSK